MNQTMDTLMDKALTVDMELMVGENQYFEPKDMTKIKQIFKK